MSHKVERAYISGRKAWWQNSTYQGDAIAVHLENAVTSEVAMKAAGLDWLVRKVPAGFLDPSAFDVDGNPIWRDVPGECFIQRDSDGSILGRATMSYQEYQNAEAFQFLDALVKDGDALYHTAGSLERGKEVWILMQTPAHWKIRRKSGKVDHHYGFLLVILGHDGKIGIRIMPTDVRAECANTTGYAAFLATRENLIFRVKHTGNVNEKMNLAAHALEVMQKETAERREFLQAMAQMAMDTDEFMDFATSVFLNLDGEPEKVEELTAKFYEEATPRMKTIMENKVAKVTRLFISGQGNEGDSAYDALNAFTEFFDHDHADEAKQKIDKAKRGSKALKSAWIGAGAERKALVYKRLRERVMR